MNIIKRSIYSMLTCISPLLNTKVLYYFKFRKKLDLTDPKTLNDKILWLKYHSYNDNKTIKQCADKYEVRNYLLQHNQEAILNDLLGAYKNVEDIPWDTLPDQFALKLNVGCGCNLICSDKSKLNIELTKEMLRKWLKTEYWMPYAEMQYKDVPKYILVEKYLGNPDGSLPVDYKFYCINGKAEVVMICTDREIGKTAKFLYYDRNWKLMPYSQDALDNPDIEVAKPKMIEKAFAVAEELSKPFPFVRTDLYIVNDKIYFGEFTFTPSAGLDRGRLPETDLILGKKLQLPM